MSSPPVPVARRFPGAQSTGRLARAFGAAAADGRAAFVAYLTAGDPSIDVTVSVARSVARAGADVLELGVPFSDPIADGPVIQQAAVRALEAGTTLAAVFEAGRRIRQETDLSLVLFTRPNPLLRFGMERAARAMRDAGFDGVLITDLPPEEAPGYQPLLRAAGLDTVFLVTPTSTPARMAAAVGLSSGFVYVVSRSGITGARGGLDASVPATIRRARKAAPRLPLALGFGISTPAAASRAAAMADGVVVGSALVAAVREAVVAGRSPEIAAAGLVETLAAACRARRPVRRR